MTIIPLLTLGGIKRIYRTGGETIATLDGVDLKMEAGEVTLLLGPSGSSKTTFIGTWRIGRMDLVTKVKEWGS